MLAFSDTTNKNGIIQLCETHTGKGDGGISGDSILLKIFTGLINIAMHKVYTMILESQDDWDIDDASNTDYPAATTTLVANQRDYTFPTSLKILKEKRIDVSYDGTNYYRAEPIDINEISNGVGNDTLLDAHFDKTKPYYDMKANSLWIYPMPTTSTGYIRIEYSRELNEFTSTDTTKTLPIDTPVAEIVPILASASFCLTNAPPLYAPLMQLAGDYEVRLRRYYGSKNSDRKYNMKSAYTNYN